MVNFIIINLFGWSGIWICKRFRGIFQYIILSVKLDITIINDMMIGYSHDSRNHRNGLGRMVAGFEINCWRLFVLLSWWFIWFIAVNCIEFIHIYPKTGWEEVRTTDYSCVSLFPNYPISFTNNFLYNTYICNEWLERRCISVVGRWSAKIIIFLTLRSQVIWVFDNL